MPLRFLLACSSLLLATHPAPAAPAGLSVHPSAFTLTGKAARQWLIVTSRVGEREVDRTREARFTTDTPAVVAVSPDGVVTPVGDFRNGAAVVFRDRREPDEITTLVSQLFLGVRLECARCHHHPFERWGQDDFYSFAAYFARIGRRGVGLSPPISGGEEALFLAPRGGEAPPHRQGAAAPTPVREGGRGGRGRPPAGAGRLGDLAREPLLREGDRQPGLGRPDGPRGRPGR